MGVYGERTINVKTNIVWGVVVHIPVSGGWGLVRRGGGHSPALWKPFTGYDNEQK